MKKFVFIDNDFKEKSLEDMFYVKHWFDNLKEKGFVLPEIEIKSDFHHLEREEQCRLLFAKDQVIVTWSMYTFTHFNSLGQLKVMLESAARNEIQDRIYIDSTNNQLFEALENMA